MKLRLLKVGLSWFLIFLAPFVMELYGLIPATISCGIAILLRIEDADSFIFAPRNDDNINKLLSDYGYITPIIGCYYLCIFSITLYIYSDDSLYAYIRSYKIIPVAIMLFPLFMLYAMVDITCCFDKIKKPK